MKWFLRVCCLLAVFFAGCNVSVEEGLLINISWVDEMMKDAPASMDSILFQSNLNLQFTDDDYLPTGWDISEPLEFFELDRLTSEQNGFQLLLYCRVLEKNGKPWDVRVATLDGQKVKANFPIWQNSVESDHYAKILKREGEYIAEIFKDGELVGIYLMEQGVFQPS